MSSIKGNQYISFAVGKSGDSTGQPSDNRRQGRGLVKEQDEPLVLWWVKLLKRKYSADQKGISRQVSYRRSGWGHPAEKNSLSPQRPFLAMHSDGRLFIALALALGLTASLNTVAQADDCSRLAPAVVNEIPSQERFSMMKDFAGRHNQYLDLSKLSDFKWSDEIHIASRRTSQKPLSDGFSASKQKAGQAQPQMVHKKIRKKMHEKSIESGKNDRELTDLISPPEKSTENGFSSDSSSSRIESIESN